MAIYKCTVTTTSNSHIAQNVFYHTAASSMEGSIGDAFVAEAQAEYLAAINAAATLRDIVVTDIGSLAQYAVTINAAGTRSGELLPPQCAAVLTWRTAKVGKAYRGRTYIPWGTESDQTAGTWSAGYQSVLNDLRAALRTAWPLAASSQFVIYHRATGTTDPVTSGLTRDIVRNQRRRMFDVGI